MNISKSINNGTTVVPLLAALPFSIEVGKAEAQPEAFRYSPMDQRTVYHMGNRDYSTCKMDESIGGVLHKSKSDTKKDD